LQNNTRPAIGFVNEKRLQAGDEDRVRFVAAMAGRGDDVGQSHLLAPDFNRRTVEQFQEDIVKGESLRRH
jgi:hypothetical protein